MSIQVMKQALEALEEADIKCNFICYEAKIALRAAIEAAEKQEPAAWLNKKISYMSVLTKPNDGGGWFPVFTTPQPAIPAWQPIETAPKGISVLACNATGYIGRAIFHYGKWDHIGNPTHWMPLPAAPKPEEIK